MIAISDVRSSISSGANADMLISMQWATQESANPDSIGALVRNRTKGDTITSMQDCSNQSGNPSFLRFSAIRFRVAGEKTIACLNFETVRSG